MKQLIVCADDLGLHPSINRAAALAHRDGILTAASVMVTAPHADEAFALLRASPSLEAGVHLALVDAVPAAAPSEIPTLLGSDGRFTAGYGAFALRWFSGRIGIGEAEHELRAQIEKALSSGLTVTHLNSHQHLHAVPRLFSLVTRLASEYGIPYLRRPLDRGANAGGFVRRISISALAWLAARGEGTGGVRSCERAIGIARAGHLDEGWLEHEIGSAGPGVIELVTHPADDNEAMRRTFDWGYDWESELRMLTSSRVREAITAAGVRLVRPSEV